MRWEFLGFYVGRILFEQRGWNIKLIHSFLRAGQDLLGQRIPILIGSRGESCWKCRTYSLLSVCRSGCKDFMGFLSRSISKMDNLLGNLGFLYPFQYAATVLIVRCT
jgi:hypothetical protein